MVASMQNHSGPIPLDLSGFRDTPPATVAPLVERVAHEPEEKALGALTALLMNRLLRLLRQGSRQEILDESLMLNRVLAMEAGAHLRQSRPEVFGGWSALGELLSGAARSTGRAAVPSILSGTRGREILELLAGEGQPVARSEIKRRLELTSESHLSHLLRDLEEADLVVRYKPARGKEVLVELGPVGRQIVDQSVIPLWLKELERLGAEAASGASTDLEAVIQDLQKAGAPSRSAAERLAALILRPPAAAPAAPANGEEGTRRSGKVLQFIQKVTNLQGDDNRLQEMLDRQGDQSPRALFVTEEPALAARS
jgi:DNA-binding HxlR family transcriptional regulator